MPKPRMNDALDVKVCPHCHEQSLKSTPVLVDGLQIWICEKCKRFAAIPEKYLASQPVIPTAVPPPSPEAARSGRPAANGPFIQLLNQAANAWFRLR